ncbi:type II secretion system F family protein [Nocardioides nanhaiensis]|uniref:Type II secretion system protein GspF domain-containing protein n=1 Tax=Nocardioides nanhaiensis TaxID=1476871 RepID=A0ABP8VSH4_9ACTN
MLPHVIPAVLAGLSAAGVLLLVLPAAPRFPDPGGDVGDRRPGWLGLSLAAAAVGLALLLLDGSSLVLVLLGAGVLLAARRLVAARRRSVRAEEVSARVLDLCEQLAAELTAGQPPAAALDRAAGDWPLVAPVAETFRVGGDVPGALRGLAGGPGAGQLRVVAAAWQVAHGSGGGLAEAVQRVASDLRADRATARVVDGELASARATARLVACLPVVALLMGSGVGGDPWAFLLGHPVGLACLASGLALGLAGLAWIEALARAVTATPPGLVPASGESS